MSGLGAVLSIALLGVVFALAPGYLGLAPASIPSDASLSVASSLWIWGVLGLVIELDRLRTFQANIGETGLGYLLIAAALLSLIAALYVGLQIVELPGSLTYAFKFIVVCLSLPTVLFVAGTLDELFIKPRVQPQKRPTQRKTARNEVLGSIGALIAWVLANVANLLTILDQLLGKS